MPTLILLGDLSPSGLSHITWKHETLSQALVIGNLETPLCSAALPSARKAGPILQADPEILIDLVRPFPHIILNLANNHMMDKGAAGLRETQEHCRRANVLVTGAGNSRADATNPVFTQVGNLRIACIGACERQFGLATDDTPGVAALGPDILARISNLRTHAQRIVVSVHGAAEMSPWPSPRWRAFLMAMIDAGADIVHGHHAHIPQGYERHGNGWIVYGAGNTLVNPSLWPEGGGTVLSWRYHFDLLHLHTPPVVETWRAEQSMGESRQICIQRVDSDESRMHACNLPLTDPILLEALWQTYALRLWDSFYGEELGLTGRRPNTVREFLKPLIRFLKAVILPSSERARLDQQRRFHYHLYACEHHSEAIATALSVLVGERPDRRSDASRHLTALWMPK